MCGDTASMYLPIDQSINTFITRHGTDALDCIQLFSGCKLQMQQSVIMHVATSNIIIIII